MFCLLTEINILLLLLVVEKLVDSATRTDTRISLYTVNHKKT